MEAGTETALCPGADQARGIEMVRPLDENERALLQSAYEACRDRMPTCVRTIHWLNLYLNGAFTVEYAERDRLDRWIRQTVASVYADWREVHILSYGFIVNPARNPEGQPFHLDYSRTSSNLFVPLTPVTLNNASQFIREPLSQPPRQPNDAFGTVEDILEAEGRQAIEVCQLVCRPFSLVRLLPNTPHRGVPNGEESDRVMLWVTVDERRYDLPETTYFQLGERDYGAL